MIIHLIAPRSPVQMVSEREKMINFSRLSLATVAALFPKDAKIKIINDGIDEIDYNDNVDLVGITSLTSTAPRAYEIADNYRKKKIPVILGGIHPTALPAEASLHADAVVIGEAEGKIEELIKDFKRGKMKKFYSSKILPSLDNLPIPRHDLFGESRYLEEINMIQTSRGCPYNCSFCSVSQFFGRTYRVKPVEDIVKEVKTLNRHTLLFFVDDNIAGNHKHSIELFKALIPLNIKWFGQASITIANNRELLRLAARSGCLALFIGFESVSKSSLKEVGKSWNQVERYKEAIKIIHSYGISIIGAFIFGFDSDDKSVFEETVSFIDKNSIELPSFSILTPFPGTRLFDEMEEQKRIIERDWSKYTNGEVVIRPKRLTVEELYEGYLWVRKEVSSFNSILKRTIHPRMSTLLFFPVNIIMRKASRSTMRTRS